MKIKCLKISTAGNVGDIKEFPNERARVLISKGICEEVKSKAKAKTEIETEKKEDKKKKDKK